MKEFLAFVVMAVIGFLVGGSCGGNINENKFEDWEEEAIQELTHEIIIHWGYDDVVDSYLYVREDLPFTINGSSNTTNYYNFYPRYGDDGGHEDIDFESLNNEPISLPSQAIREGYKLEGFYTGEHGGTLVINAAGYGLMTIKSNVELYAYWTKIE